MSKSNYLENELLDHVLGGADWPRPATVYIALFTAAPTDAGGGTEVAGGSYVRVAVTNDAANWPAAVAGVKANANAVTFPAATGVWGNCVAFAVFDAAAAGNMLFWAVLTTPKVVAIGDVFSFAVGSLTFTED